MKENRNKPQSEASSPLRRRIRVFAAFLTSMRTAVVLLGLTALLSVTGTLIPQEGGPAALTAAFGPFWAEIFAFLGLDAVYTSWGFVAVFAFLLLSVSLCLYRRAPKMIKQSHHSHFRYGSECRDVMLPPPKTARRYFEIRGYRVHTFSDAAAPVILTAEKGRAGRWGYILIHVGVAVICLGALTDSALPLKTALLTGHIRPDSTARTADDFPKESRIPAGLHAFRGEAAFREGQSTDGAFLRAGNGYVLQELPFVLRLDRFHADYYEDGRPKDYAAAVTITHKADGRMEQAEIRVNSPFTTDGISIFQSAFGNDGSELKLSAEALGAAESMPAKTYTLSVPTAGPVSIGVGDKRFRLRAGAVEYRRPPVSGNEGETDAAGAVPAVRYSIKDSSGRTAGFTGYIRPVTEKGGLYYLTVLNGPADNTKTRLMVPADSRGSPDLFSTWRRLLMQPEARKMATARISAGVGREIHDRYAQTVATVLDLFAEGGYPAVSRFVDNTVPAESAQNVRELFAQILLAGAGDILDSAAASLPGRPEAGAARERFLADSLKAYSQLQHYPVPLFVRVADYRNRQSAVLQISRSPGRYAVYTGSALLLAGLFLSFFINRRQIRLVYAGEDGGSLCWTSFAGDNGKEMAAHLENLQRLSQEIR